MSILSQQKQSVNTDFPNIRPSLDLRFALAKKLDPRVTFTRGSTGTYFGPDGLMRTAGVNEPRFDHDPVTGRSLGLLIEESRANLLVRSEEFNMAGWGRVNTSINANSVAAPDGLTTADLLIESLDTTSPLHTLYQAVNVVSGKVYTFSAFIKAAPGARSVAMFASNANFTVTSSATFNPSNGTVSLIQNATVSITSFPNGWYRCVLTTVAATSSGANNFNFRLSNGSITSYAGDGTSGIYVWGAQVEEGAFPTTYIPTVASTVTRSADNANMTGNNFSSWYNQTEGTILVNLVPNYSNSVANRFRRFLTISAGSGIQDNLIQLISLDSINQIQFAVWTGSVFQAGTNLTVLSGTSGKIGYSIKQNSCVLAGNGQLLQNDNASIIPTILNRMDIGGYVNNNGYQSTSTISRITYYPIQLTNQQMINLTS